MSATGSELVEAPASTPQVEALLRDCVALKDALGRARRVRQVLMLATIAFVAVACWLFYGLGKKLQSQENIDEVRRLAEARLSENSGRYMTEVQLLVDRASPVLTDAFYKQA